MAPNKHSTGKSRTNGAKSAPQRTKSTFVKGLEKNADMGAGPNPISLFTPSQDPPVIGNAGETWVPRTYQAVVNAATPSTPVTLADVIDSAPIGDPGNVVIEKVRVWSLSALRLDVALRTDQVSTFGADDIIATDFGSLTTNPCVGFRIDPAHAKFVGTANTICLVTPSIAKVPSALTGLPNPVVVHLDCWTRL